MVELLRAVGSFIFKSVNFIPIAILIAKTLEVWFRIQGKPFTLIDPNGTPTFISSFIEWFGVIYGILLPLMLVRVWEQLDAIDREFDREADAVKFLYEDIFYLPVNSANFAKGIGSLLREYVIHVKTNYRYEIKPNNTKDDKKRSHNIFIQVWRELSHVYDSILNNLNQFLNPDQKNVDPDKLRIEGDTILENIRVQYKRLIISNQDSTKEWDPFITEIFKRFNDIVDIRGDRIGLASQRLFESLRIVALITSITFVLPFYFVGFTPNTPPLDNILIIGVTLLVIFVYLIIDDFDEPFGGTWRITDNSWQRVLEYMDSPERRREFEDLGKDVVLSKSIDIDNKVELNLTTPKKNKTKVKKARSKSQK